ncbi:MAG: trigger factor [Anaerolineae bacterium]|nr:trigger factor [Anaerolineae bacterium]
MKVITERLENCIVALQIQVDDQETHNYLRNAARKLSQDYRIPGFRPGKAPYNVVVQRLGLEAIKGQVVDQFGDKVFEEGLKESGLEPVDQASLENVTWDPLTLHLKVPVAPTINLGGYRDIRIGWEDPTVTDEDLEEELTQLRRQHGEWQEVERGAELGDQIIIDIAGKVEDKVVLGNTGREMVLNADSPYPISGFANQIVGMKVDETREFDLTYPEDHYNPDTAGKEAHFEATLHKIKVENLPELNDEFAVLVGDYENLDDLKTKLRQSLQERAETQAREDYLDQIWDHLLKEAVVEYPQVYVDRELEAMKQQIESQLKQNNMDLETYFKLTNSSEEAWKENTRPQAAERLVRRLILGEVIEQEKIKAQKEEIDAEIERVVTSLGEEAQSIREWLQGPMGSLNVAENLLTDKAIDRLIAIAKGQAPSREEIELKSETEESPTEAAPIVECETAQAVEAETEATSETGTTQAVEDKEDQGPQDAETHDVEG